MKIHHLNPPALVYLLIMPPPKRHLFAAGWGLEFQAANEMHTEGRHGLHRFQTRRFDPRSLSGEPPPLEGCQVNWNHRMLGVSFGLVGHLNLISGGHRVMAQQLLKSNRTTLMLHTSPGVKFKATHALRKHSCPPLQKNMTKCFILLHDMSFQ